MKKTVSFAILASCFFMASMVFADGLSEQEITNKAYIFGFLAGLKHRENETGIMASESQPNMQSEFFQRAYKSRLGGEPQGLAAEFCLPKNGMSDQQLQDMVSKFNNISNTSPSDKAQQLYQVVKRTYPCS